MASESTSKKIKIEEDDDDNLKKTLYHPLQSPSDILGKTWFNKREDSKPFIDFLVHSPDRSFRCSMKLPYTFTDFADLICWCLNQEDWDMDWRRHRFYGSDYERKLLTQYYDENTQTCISLSDKDWLEWREHIIERWHIKTSKYFDKNSRSITLMVTYIPRNINIRGEISYLHFLESYHQFNRYIKEPPVAINENGPCIALNWNLSAEDSDKHTPSRTLTTTQEEKVIETPSGPLSRLNTLKHQISVIDNGYSLVCLLSEADSFPELKDIGCNVQTYHKSYECVSYLATSIEQKLIVIVSQSLATNFIPIIHDFIQVMYIYVLHKYDSLCTSGDENFINNKQYPKVRASSIEQNMLISKINDDLKQLSNTRVRLPDFPRGSIKNNFYTMSKQSSSKSLSAEEKHFVSYQLIIKTILESGNANPLNKITTALQLDPVLIPEINDEFKRKYVSEKAIHFYTNNTSLKTELDTCFREENIEKICKLWFFIHDLLKRLPAGKKKMTVYRGQCITKDAIKQLNDNVNSFVTFTTFFTMSTSSIHAIYRTEEDCSNPELSWMIFQLDIDDESTSTRFCMLEQSYEETIFLFAAGNVFFIESIGKSADHIWLCKLSINSNHESVLNGIFQHYEKEIGTALTYLSLGAFLDETGKDDLARRYYKILLELSTDSNSTCCINNNLAIIYEHRKDLTNAQICWDLAAKGKNYETRSSSVTPKKQNSDIIIAHPVPGTSPIISYYNLACAYQQQGRFDEALEVCKQALELSKTVPESRDSALVHSAIGSIYFRQQKYPDALISFQEALGNALNHRLPTDPLIDQYLNNIRILKTKLDGKESSEMRDA